MKLSLYNTYLPLEENSVLVFNAMEDSFLGIFGYRFDASTPIEEIQERVSKETWDNLVKGGAIVEKSKDEVETLRNRIKEVDEDDTIFILHINPTLDCNFKCWYCYETHKPGSRIDSATITSILSLVKSILEEKKDLKIFRLSFFGGEPLLAFEEVKTIIEGISRLCKEKEVSLTVSFTTNGYLLDEEKITWLRPYRASFQITLDGGSDHHNKTRFEKGGVPSFDRILSHIVRCVENTMFVTLRINFTTKNIDSASEIVEKLKDVPAENRQYLCVDFQRVWQDGGRAVDETYNKARNFRRKLQELGYDVSNNRILNGVRSSCYGDKKNYLLVNYNGDVFCCTAREFSEDNRMGRLLSVGVEWDFVKRERHLASKFSQTVCQDCRIAPLCGGGCRRQAMEHLNLKGCMYSRSEADIDEFVIERFEERFLKES